MVTGIPAVFMVVMTVWALVVNQAGFLDRSDVILVVLNTVILGAAVWIAVEGLVRFLRAGPGPEPGQEGAGP